MRVLVRTCGGSEVATLDAELSWRKEDVLAALPARTHDLPCEERMLVAGTELCENMTLAECDVTDRGELTLVLGQQLLVCWGTSWGWER